jgi:hypothetical protein
MKDIFNSEVQFGGSWVLDGAVLQLSDGSELIVSRVDITYGRPINRILPLNSAKQFIIAGRGQGNITLGVVLGPGKGLKTIITKYADPCQISKNSMTISPTGKVCCDAGTACDEKLQFIASYCLLQTITSSAQAGDLAIMSAGMTFMIGALELK